MILREREDLQAVTEHILAVAIELVADKGQVVRRREAPLVGLQGGEGGAGIEVRYLRQLEARTDRLKGVDAARPYGAVGVVLEDERRDGKDRRDVLQRQVSEFPPELESETAASYSSSPSSLLPARERPPLDPSLS